MHVIYPRCYEAEASTPRVSHIPKHPRGQFSFCHSLLISTPNRTRNARLSRFAQYSRVTNLSLDILEDNGLEVHVIPYTQVKVDGPVRPRNGPVRPRNGPVTALCLNGPVFRSLNISTFHCLRTPNGPIIFTGLSEPVITGLLRPCV